MLSVNIICVGKISEKYIKDGIAEFNKRLSAYAKVKVIEIKEYTNSDEAQITSSYEGRDILKALQRHKGYNILLHLKGKSFSSEGMAKEINHLSVAGNSSLNFIIGGSHGVSEDVEKIAHLKLKFSDFTFPHQLMRLILLEQLYRWFNILNNGRYHK